MAKKEPSFFRFLSGEYSQIRAEYKAGRQDLLVETVQKMAARVNQRFYRLEKKGVGLGENAYRYAQQETGKTKPRYTESVNKLRSMSINDLYELALQINKKLVTPTSTIRGTQRLIDKRLEQSSRNLRDRGIDVSADDVKALIDAGGDEFLNDKLRFGSDQILLDYEQYVLKGKVTLKEFVSGLDEYKRKTRMKYSTVQRKFKKLNRSKTRKRRK